ncbi:hypothetical protein [Mangrovibacterium diazotrophicum]|uniref:Uncharacterized protein n=1 Tax=Mangrovibacterium diazotrophicum TaxID=1261403 RepID=A0A419VWV5_9BACT|nr:hypothetical protein [Mangrovibacterium diazotrophicum]RKD87707.1 hypothetical protein BC643_3714 [Mangrovibacterium diazotrophicum]
MKNDRLEDFVRTHRDEFDLHDPSPEMWAEINRKLPVTVSKRSVFVRWASVAAIFAVVILGSTVLIRSLRSDGGGTVVAQEEADPEVKELLEAEAYYAQQVNGKLEEIRKCYALNPELQVEVEDDLTELEQMYDVLKEDLAENVSNKAVIEAMIENNRFRLKLVNDVLEQVNC